MTSRLRTGRAIAGSRWTGGITRSSGPAASAAGRGQLGPGPPVPPAGGILARVDESRRRWDPRRHPLHERWAAGRAPDDELAHYAGQYEHLVIAVAAAAKRAALIAPAEWRHRLTRHAAQRADHIRIWGQYRRGLGVGPAVEPDDATVQCARAIVGQEPRGLGGVLGILCALDADHAAAALPGVTQDGGRVDDDVPRACLAAWADGRHGDAVLETIEHVLSTRWLLLTGIHAR